MPIEARGRRDPALAAALKAGQPPVVTEWEYVVGRRPLKVGEETRQPGDPLPEAASWPRLESWLRSGAVVQRPPSARTVSAPVPTPGARPAPRKAAPAEPAEEEPKRPVLRPRKGAN